MKFFNNNIFYSIVSFLIIFLASFYLYLFNESAKLIKFSSSGISIDFEVEISNNIKDIENFLINYEFIESYLVRLINKDLNIEINLKKPFAKNNLNQEIIFEDGSVGSFSYFNNEYIQNIELIDISEESLMINDYLDRSIDQLKSIRSEEHTSELQSRQSRMSCSVLEKKNN